MTPRKVLIAAGGTGGHVYPALALATELRDRGHAVSFVGGDRIEAAAVPGAGFELHRLPARSLPRSVSLEAASSAWAFARSLAGARALVTRLRPDVVVGFGGYPSLAPALASGRVPVVLHEQNAVLSLANRLSLRRTCALALSLPLRDPLAWRGRVAITGNPLRASVLRTVDGAAARRSLGLQPDGPVVLAFGGSLGSKPINDALPGCMPDGVQVLHLTGREGSARWDRPAVVLAYCDAIEECYAAADLVVCRAGATTVAELCALGKPSVLVPLPFAPRGAQEANAQVLERSGAAVMVEQGEGFERRLRTAIARLVSDRKALDAMASAARTLAHADASARLADLVEEARPG